MTLRWAESSWDSELDALFICFFSSSHHKSPRKVAIRHRRTHIIDRSWTWFSCCILYEKVTYFFFFQFPSEINEKTWENSAFSHRVFSVFFLDDRFESLSLLEKIFLRFDSLNNFILLVFDSWMKLFEIADLLNLINSGLKTSERILKSFFNYKPQSVWFLIHFEPILNQVVLLCSWVSKWKKKGIQKGIYLFVIKLCYLTDTFCSEKLLKTFL